ncbi:hypothetical protein DL96DRAFT_1821092 [Flagelloscypha sp. PMI_526]|nr:hypothetical protein DL96DRAFT_1821092 [Flagelloscypha sp. PMI_526]
MSLGPAYAKLHAMARSVGPDVMVIAPFVSRSGEDPSSSSIPKSMRPNGTSTPIPNILGSLPGGGSASYTSNPSTGDSKTQYEESEIDNKNSDNTIASLSGDLGQVYNSIFNWNPDRWKFTRELTEPDTSRRSIMSLD